MNDRITSKDLEAVVARINEVTESPAEPYTKDEDGRLRAQIGNYHISGAYGGVCLHRMVNEGGGVSSIFGLGYMPKRELYGKMQAFLGGMAASKAVTV